MSPTCATPWTDEAFLAWWAGELAAPEQDALEEHVLSCDECARRGRTLAAVAEGLQALVREGEVPTAMPPAVIERLQREGRRIREYRVRPGEGVQCTVSPDDDVVLAALRAELKGVSRLDLVVRVDDGPEQRFPDLPFDPEGDELVFAPSADTLRAMPAHVQQLRLVAVDPEGERVLGEYTFTHTPWPGPDVGPSGGPGGGSSF
jgi:hypothetical protein